MKASGAANDAAMDRPGVPWWMHALSGLQARHPRAAIALGNFESRLLRDRIERVPLRRPVYIAGLARSGTTILLELLARHPELASHRYRDFPPVCMPYAWNRFVDRATLRRPAQPKERAHADGIQVTAESPEAFEEVLWMAFFPWLHDPAHSAVVGRDMRHPGFERFYRDHLRKLVLVRGRSRYLSKANYHVTRLGWLHGQFPDASFLVPLRDPVWHIASLMKEHSLFCADHARNRRTRAHMARSGHFEFGLDRRPINTGEHGITREIVELWQQGDRAAEIEGWARYWAAIHDHLADVLSADEALRRATLVVPYEALCGKPAAVMQAVLKHCALAPDAALVDHAARTLKLPGYYKPAFDGEELVLIHRHTAFARRRIERFAGQLQVREPGRRWG